MWKVYRNPYNIGENVNNGAEFRQSPMSLGFRKAEIQLHNIKPSYSPYSFLHACSRDAGEWCKKGMQGVFTEWHIFAAWETSQLPLHASDVIVGVWWGMVMMSSDLNHCLKHFTKLMTDNSDWYRSRFDSCYLRQRLCFSDGLRKNYWPDFHETWWKGSARSKEETITFWSGFESWGGYTNCFSLRDRAFGLVDLRSLECPSSFWNIYLPHTMTDVMIKNIVAHTIEHIEKIIIINSVR